MHVYRECAPPAWAAGAVEAVWWVWPVTGTHLVLPDGCVDLVWTDGDLRISGPMTRARDVRVTGEALGVRLRPGAAGVLGVTPHDIVDDLPSAADVWGADGRRVAERVGEAAPGDRPALLLTVLAARTDGGRAADPTVRAAADGLLAGATVREVARSVWMSERQLRRRILREVGLAPAALRRVGRLQALLRAASETPGASVAALAAAAGYADESHCARDVRVLAGLGPRGLLDERGM